MLGIVGTGPSQVELDMELPLPATSGVSCLADWSSTDYTVALPPGYSGDRELQVVVDLWTMELPPRR